MSHPLTRRDFAKVAGAAALGASALPTLGASVPPQSSTGTAPQDAAARTFPAGFPVGHRDRGVSGRRRRHRGRPRPVGLGHVLAHARQGRERRDRRRRRRPLPPLQGGRAADEVAGRQGVPLLDRVVARVSATAMARRTRRASTSTTGSSTSCSRTASSRSRRCITGTCRSRCRTASAAGNRATRRRLSATTRATSPQRLTDRVKHIFTINEFGAFVELGYRVGIHAPGLKLPPGRFNQTRHHAVLGHGLAVQAIRAKREARHEGRPRREHDDLRAGHRDGGAHRGRRSVRLAR